MKKNIIISFFVLSCFDAFAQNGYYDQDKTSPEKYLIAVGYGVGTAHWSSVFKNADFYDKDGSIIHSGDLRFSANSPTKNYDINVMAPIKHIRLGLGIAFEFHYLAQLRVYTKDGDDYLLFDEGLRFDKIYLQTEIPFKYKTDKKYTLNWKMKLGWFGYTNVRRFEFLGNAPFAVSMLVCSGVTADYEMYPKVYIFVFPNFEYKLYNNAMSSTSVKVRHNVFSACLLGGIRVDLGRFYNNNDNN